MRGLKVVRLFVIRQRFAGSLFVVMVSVVFKTCGNGQADVAGLKIASTAACDGLLAAVPGSLWNHVALPNAKPPPAVFGFERSSIRQSRWCVSCFERVERSMPSMTLPRSSATLAPKRAEISVV